MPSRHEWNGSKPYWRYSRPSEVWTKFLASPITLVGQFGCGCRRRLRCHAFWRCDLRQCRCKCSAGDVFGGCRYQGNPPGVRHEIHHDREPVSGRRSQGYVLSAAPPGRPTHCRFGRLHMRTRCAYLGGQPLQEQANGHFPRSAKCALRTPYPSRSRIALLKTQYGSYRHGLLSSATGRAPRGGPRMGE